MPESLYNQTASYEPPVLRKLSTVVVARRPVAPVLLRGTEAAGEAAAVHHTHGVHLNAPVGVGQRRRIPETNGKMIQRALVVSLTSQSPLRAKC